MKLLVGVPSNGLVRAELITCLIPALFRTTMTALHILAPTGCYITQNRNTIAQTAVDEEFDRILFVDADMVFPDDAIEVLRRRDKDIIGAAYNVRQAIPSQTTVKWDGKGKLPTNGPFRCQGMGMGFVLVKTDVFRRMEKPWFYLKDLGNNDFEGEDYYFFSKAIKTGYDVWCDPTIKMEHIGDYRY